MGVYKLQARESQMFRFEYKGKTHNVPLPYSLKFKTFMRIREAADNPEKGFDEIMAVFLAYAPEAMEEMIMEEAKELFAAYAAYSPDSMGES